MPTPVARLDQFGRTGLINEMSNKLTGGFMTCVESKLTAETTRAATKVPPEKIKVMTLRFASLWTRIARLYLSRSFRNATKQAWTYN